MPKFTAIVRKKVTFRRPVLNTSAKPLLVDPSGKELPKDDEGAYIGSGVQKIETITTESVDDPLTDEAGGPIERGTVDALLGAIRDHFAEEEDTEILNVKVQETKTIMEVSGADLAQKA